MRAGGNRFCPRFAVAKGNSSVIRHSTILFSFAISERGCRATTTTRLTHKPPNILICGSAGISPAMSAKRENGWDRTTSHKPYFFLVTAAFFAEREREAAERLAAAVRA